MSNDPVMEFRRLPQYIVERNIVDARDAEASSNATSQQSGYCGMGAAELSDF